MLYKISLEVQQALKENKPVIALESTIISHGMPYPQNVETALKVEQIIRDNGCIPATIGIIEGTPIIGMSKDEIELFGKTPGILKASRRDLPVIMAKKLWGATTVATTMILASIAGIEVFVTGGIGASTAIQVMMMSPFTVQLSVYVPSAFSVATSVSSPFVAITVEIL